MVGMKYPTHDRPSGRGHYYRFPAGSAGSGRHGRPTDARYAAALVWVAMPGGEALSALLSAADWQRVRCPTRYVPVPSKARGRDQSSTGREDVRWF